MTLCRLISIRQKVKRLENNLKCTVRKYIKKLKAGRKNYLPFYLHEYIILVKGLNIKILEIKTI